MTEETGKQKRNKRFIYIGLGIVALVITFFVGRKIYRRWKEKKALEEAAKKELAANAFNNLKPGDPGMNTPEVDDSFPLVIGSKGDNVRYLQQALNRLGPKFGMAPLSEDGNFGKKTYDAVITWVNTKSYPVSQVIWTDILKRSFSSAA
jgi:hypothetical protein